MHLLIVCVEVYVCVCGGVLLIVCQSFFCRGSFSHGSPGNSYGATDEEGRLNQILQKTAEWVFTFAVGCHGCVIMRFYSACVPVHVTFDYDDTTFLACRHSPMCNSR